MAAPIPLPKPKRRWGRLTLWSLLMFGAGVAVGPLIITQARGLLGLPVPAAEPAKTAPVAAEVAAPAKPTVEPLPAEPVPSEPVAAPQPVAAKEPEPPAPEPAKVEAAAAPAEEAPAPVEPAGKSGSQRKGHKAEAKRASGGYQDPFLPGGAKAKGEPAAKAKAEPAKAEPAAPKSRDGLDGLMGGVAETKAPEKKHSGKGLDAILQEVQKGGPEPAPKKEAAPAPAAQLSQSDIVRVMGGVQKRASECARRYNDRGVAELKLTVSKDGGISAVTLGGKMAGTQMGSCVEQIVRAAQFPKSAGLRFDYRLNVRP